MAVETSTILRAILIQIKKADSLFEIEKSVEAMCTKDDIDAVDKAMTEIEAKAKQSKP